MKNINVTFFSSSTSRDDKIIPLSQVLSDFRTGRYAEAIENVRQVLVEEGPIAYSTAKKNLPAIAFCGEFSGGHAKSNIVKYNDLMIIDIDHISEDDMLRVRECLMSDEYVFSFWCSPSGLGYKGLIHIKYINETQSFTLDQKHKAAFNIIYKYLLDKYDIKMFIFAIPSLDYKKRKTIINEIVDLGVDVKSVPFLNNWIDNNLTADQIEEIKIEDLLGREPIVLGKENVTEGLNGKVVMVTGAAGSIGSEICRQVLHYKPKKLILVDQAESPLYDIQFELRNNEPYRSFNVPMEFVIGNVKDSVKMREVFSKYRPQIVYHAAAYKHVPLMEEFPYEAVFVNVLGTKNVADLAIEFEVEKFVMVSTDKAVNPTNVMGATKRIAEIYTQSRKSEKTAFVTTRFGNVLGSNGSVIPLFKKQLAYGGPLTVTDRNIIRYFMTIPEACSLVLEAGVMGEKGDIFVFDMGEPVKIYDLAKKMIKLSHKQNIEIEITGLRPGEKLYEELLSTKENTIPTEHAKIMRAKVRRYTEEEVNEKIDTLINLISTCDDFKIVAQMKNIVPEFISNNSIYSCLDKKEN